MSTLIFNTVILTEPLFRFNFKLKIQYQSYYKDTCKYNQAVSGTLETNFDAITECSKESGCSQVICQTHGTCHVYLLLMWLRQSHNACWHLPSALVNIERANFIQKLQSTIIYLKRRLVRGIHFLMNALWIVFQVQ